MGIDEEEKMMEITKEMLLGEILGSKPESAGILTEMGMHCLGCPSSQVESLADACMVHGLNADEVLKKLNGGIQ